MTLPVALIGASVFDGQNLQSGLAVLIEGETPRIVKPEDLPTDCARQTVPGGTLMPGFVDLQVNGGGGVMFNDDPSIDTLATIAAAHHQLGTRAFLPTLITDTPNKVTAAIDAVIRATRTGVPGIVGLHLEGPHLSVSRKGAHDARLIRTMTQRDLDELLRAASLIPNMLVTVAPETVSPQQISTLSKAGICVFLGHSGADYDLARAAFDAGAKGATHLFNAMSQMTSRAPGLVGATLNTPKASAGLIADGIHVHPATLRAAITAKPGPGAFFLVTDAMAPAGTDIASFTLGGREILRRDGRLTLADGTLAGADLNMAQALSVMVKDVGDPFEIALRRATSFPAAMLSDPRGAGVWPNTLDGLIYLSPHYEVRTAADLLQ